MVCRIATEAEAEASRLVPAAETAIQTARQAALTLRGQPQELTLPYLHDLAASQLHSWLATQKDVSSFQVHAPQTVHLLCDLWVTGLPPLIIVRD